MREESDEETTSEEETTSDEETNSEYSNDFHGEDSEEQITEDTEDEIDEETKNTETAEDSDDEIFAKLKSAEKIKEVIEEQGTVVNKFRYKGKLMDILEFKQKKSKKDEPKKISFSSWKVF